MLPRINGAESKSDHACSISAGEVSGNLKLAIDVSREGHQVSDTASLRSVYLFLASSLFDVLPLDGFVLRC